MTRPRLVTVILGLVLVLLICSSVAVGGWAIPLSEAVGALFGRADASTVVVVQGVRLPRALTAALVGAALGSAGAVLQAMVRNPLASPDLLGITAGAGAGAVLFIVVGGGVLIVAGGAVAGGLAATVAVYLLAYRHGIGVLRLVLVGLAVSAMLASVTSYLLTRAEIFDAQRAFVWLVGSLDGRGWPHAVALAPVVVILLVPVLLLDRTLRVLQLGDEAATALGVRVEPVKLVLIGLSSGLASVATATAGPVAFVAFVSGPVARRLCADGRPAVLPAAMTGAVLLSGADLLARIGFAGHELPVGVITGALGAPVMLWTLHRTRVS